MRRRWWATRWWPGEPVGAEGVHRCVQQAGAVPGTGVVGVDHQLADLPVGDRVGVGVGRGAVTANPRTVARSRATSTRLRASLRLGQRLLPDRRELLDVHGVEHRRPAAGRRTAAARRRTWTAAMPGASSAQPTRTDTSATGPGRGCWDELIGPIVAPGAEPGQGGTAVLGWRGAAVPRPPPPHPRRGRREGRPHRHRHPQRLRAPDAVRPAPTGFPLVTTKKVHTRSVFARAAVVPPRGHQRPLAAGARHHDLGRVGRRGRRPRSRLRPPVAFVAQPRTVGTSTRSPRSSRTCVATPTPGATSSRPGTSPTSRRWRWRPATRSSSSTSPRRVAEGRPRPAQLPALPALGRRVPRRAVQHRLLRPADPHGRAGRRPRGGRLRAHAGRRAPLLSTTSTRPGCS